MASIKEIVEKEKRRGSIEECRVIHLYREGSFLRAYEWSAWLWVCRIRKFKISHKIFRGIEDSVALIGFPPTSLTKFVPEGAKVLDVDDRSVDVVLPPSIIPDDYEIELLLDDFELWKHELPSPTSSEEKQRKKEPASTDADNQPLRITDVMQRILAFNVNRKTPFECMEFISEIREQLISII